MADFTRIEWADHTFKPWEGCQKVGPGCDGCYAEARNARFGGGIAPNWGPHAPRRRTSPANWRKPHAWQRAAPAFFAAHGRRQRIFCASLADVFDKAAPEGSRDDLANTIRATPDLDWLLLTKRIGNAARMLREMFPEGVPPNVKLGITVVNQEEADRDIPSAIATRIFLNITGLFLSIEPMLGFITLRPDTHPAWLSHIDQIIAGGESGRSARPAHPNWFRSLRDQCAAANVPFFFKQWGEYIGGTWHGDGETVDFCSPDLSEKARAALVALADADASNSDDSWWSRLETWDGHLPDGTGPAAFRIGKRLAGRTLDGIEHNGMPA